MSDIHETLYNSAIDFINNRFGKDNPGGVAAMYTSSKKILISTRVPNHNDSAVLCHETGAICEAYKLGETITASICVTRKADNKIIIFAPCGLCQERLTIFKQDIDIAVADPQDPSHWILKKLSDLQPYYWRNYKKE